MKVVNPGDAALVTTFLLEDLDVSQGSLCLETSLLRSHAGFEVFLLQLLEVKREFLVQLIVQRPLSKHRDETLPPDADEPGGRHGYARLSTRPTADESRFQFSTSRSSCLRPSRV